MDLEILAYQEKYKQHFYDLNIEWLETHFYVEEHDKEVLENPQSYILENGGFIFFAKMGTDIVGTFALMNESEGWELSKMAVSPNYRGRKIGQHMMEFCIDFSKKKGWNEVLLYSSTILKNALYIYRKFGFKEVPLGNSPYSRGDIKMVLHLDD